MQSHRPIQITVFQLKSESDIFYRSEPSQASFLTTQLPHTHRISHHRPVRLLAQRKRRLQAIKLLLLSPNFSDPTSAYYELAITVAANVVTFPA